MGISIHTSAPIFAYCVFVAAVLGTVFGSFLNCAALRTVSGESFFRGRSRCPSCGHALGVKDLVPVLSWVSLRGRCRYCGKRISPRYCLVELLFGTLTVYCLLRFDLTPLCLRNWVFLCCLLYLTLTDLDAMIIPDGCLLTAAAAWLLTLPFLWQGWGSALADLLAGLGSGGFLLGLALVMDRVLKKESLGGGDIKLFAVAGLYLGPLGTLFALLLSCVLGLLFAFLSGVKRGKEFPFGPAIAVAVVCILFWGGPLVGWYLDLLL